MQDVSLMVRYSLKPDIEMYEAGTISIGQNKELPAVINDNSTVSVVASTNGYSMNDIFPIAVEETQNGVTKQLTHDLFPIRLLRCYKIPLYVGRKE